MITVKFIRDLLQQPDFDDFEARLVEDDPDYPVKMAAFTPLTTKMGQRTNALAFPAEILDAPLPKSDPVSLKFCLDQCKALLEEQAGVLPRWSQQVRDAIVDKIGSEQQIEDHRCKTRGHRTHAAAAADRRRHQFSSALHRCPLGDCIRTSFFRWPER